mgnify:CR=1 FL=1
MEIAQTEKKIADLIESEGISIVSTAGSTY